MVQRQPRPPLTASRASLTARSMATLGFMLLVVSQAISVVASLTITVAPSYLPVVWLRSGGSDVLVRAWGLTWLILSVVLLVVLFKSFRRAELWARLVMTSVPVVWLAHYLLAPGTVHNLIMAVITSFALAAALRDGNQV